MMHSMTLVMIGLLIAIVLVGALLGTLRVYAGRQVPARAPATGGHGGWKAVPHDPGLAVAPTW